MTPWKNTGESSQEGGEKKKPSFPEGTLLALAAPLRSCSAINSPDWEVGERGRGRAGRICHSTAKTHAAVNTREPPVLVPGSGSCSSPGAACWDTAFPSALLDARSQPHSPLCVCQRPRSTYPPALHRCSSQRGVTRAGPHHPGAQSPRQGTEPREGVRGAARGESSEGNHRSGSGATGHFLAENPAPTSRDLGECGHLPSAMKHLTSPSPSRKSLCSRSAVGGQCDPLVAAGGDTRATASSHPPVLVNPGVPQSGLL